MAIAAMPSFAGNPLPPILKAFRDRYAGINVAVCKPVQTGTDAGDDDLGSGLHHVPGLVGAHGDGDVGVLHREGAPEAATLVGGRQIDEVDATYVAQQPKRFVADAQHP